jgi:hypothetical protein
LTLLTPGHRARSSGKREAVSSTALIYRFSRGGSEYRLSEKTPKVGDVLKRDGDNWVVVAVEVQADGTTVVTLRPGIKPA